jgi:hypothetical protein
MLRIGKVEAMNVRLQKQKAYKYKDKQHFKHVIVVPEEAVNELNWQGVQELELNIKNGRLIAEAKTENEGKN